MAILGEVVRLSLGRKLTKLISLKNMLLKRVQKRIVRSVGRSRHELGSRRGASVVIALSLIAAILFFTIGTATTVMTAIKNTSNSKKALQAEYAAQGAVELVKNELKDLGSGANDGVDGEKLFLGDIQEEGAEGSIWAEYTISTVDDSNETKYAPGVVKGDRSIPVLGTGDAGKDCYRDFGYAELASDEDHPCNWNKLYYGDSVLIPLFVQKGGQAKGIGDLGVSLFEIKVRTPCEEGGIDSDCDRYGVDVTYPIPGNYTNGNILVSWQVFGECKEGFCAVSQIPDTSNSAFQELYLDLAGGEYSIYAGSDVMDVYKKNDDGQPLEGKLIDFFNDEDVWPGNGLTMPYLKLSYVREAFSPNGNIPNLEYQIMYTLGGDSGLAASYMISVDGYSEGFKYSLNGVQTMESDLFDFAVQN
jgi:hypothetical protein